MEQILQQQGEYMLTKQYYTNLNRIVYYVYRTVGNNQDGTIQLIGFKSNSKASAQRIFNKCTGGK